MKKIYLCKKDDVKYSKIIGENLDENAHYCIVYGNDENEMNYFNSNIELFNVLEEIKTMFSSLGSNISNESITKLISETADDEEMINQLVDLELIKFKKSFRCIDPYREEYVDSDMVADIKTNIIKSILLCEE